MRSLILLLFASIHSPSAFSQELQQGGFIGYGQNGVLQIGPQGMQLIVPDQKTGGLTALDLNQTVQIPPPASTAATDASTQQQAGVADAPAQQLQSQVPPQQLTCECNCPQPQQPQAQTAPQENTQNRNEAGTAAQDQGGWGQEESSVQPTEASP